MFSSEPYSEKNLSRRCPNDKPGSAFYPFCITIPNILRRIHAVSNSLQIEILRHSSVLIRNIFIPEYRQRRPKKSGVPARCRKPECRRHRTMTPFGYNERFHRHPFQGQQCDLLPDSPGAACLRQDPRIRYIRTGSRPAGLPPVRHFPGGALCSASRRSFATPDWQRRKAPPYSPDWPGRSERPGIPGSGTAPPAPWCPQTHRPAP